MPSSPSEPADLHEPPPPVGTEWQIAPPRNWYAAMPNSWDSLQLFFGVAGLVGLVGAVWGKLPKRVALGVILVGVAFHFAGILSAVTSPPPTPWITNQYWHRVSRPYLQFAYMNNAYQFYSPDPGPATEVWVCIESRPEGAGDDPTAEKRCEWLHMPRRKEHYIDPLGLSFYRRLSLTEYVAQYQAPGYVPLAAEQYQVLARRARAAQEIPRLNWSDSEERRMPSDLVTRHVLPSYARHLAEEYKRPGWEVKSIKIYRTLHLITTLAQFRGFDGTTGRPAARVGPYHPTLYLPYFQGEFNKNGELVDPMAPMLYWLVPIVQEKQLPESKDEYRKHGGLKYYFKDYVSVHAGCERPAEEGP
jgi:hypothetical protein